MMRGTADTYPYVPAVGLEALLRAIGVAALMMVPVAMLLVFPTANNPFLAGKTEGFRSACLIWTAAAMGVLLLRPRRLPGAIWLYGALAAVLAIADFHAAFRVNFAFWGEPTRMNGFIATASFFSYLIALTILPEGERFWKWFIRLWALAGVVAALSGFFQIYQQHFMVHIPLQRLFGLMGNPVFFGDFLALAILFSIWAAKESHWWLLAVAIQVPILYLTQARSGMLALLIGLAILAPIGRLSLLIGLGAGVAAIVAMAGSSHLPAVADLSHRLSCYKGEMEFIRERLWLGWGQDNLRVLCFGDTPEIWDRAHNFILQTVVDGGLLALAVYVAFLAVAFRSVVEYPFALAIFAAYVVMISLEPDAITTTVPALTALGWANRQARAVY